MVSTISRLPSANPAYTAARELIQRVGAFGGGHQAVEMDAGNTPFPQVANLVVHEDNQRRNDDGQPIHH